MAAIDKPHVLVDVEEEDGVTAGGSTPAQTDQTRRRGVQVSLRLRLWRGNPLCQRVQWIWNAR
ncbi:hypothetical protein Pyn_14874 [Prunus yedoensis var. nudiflora]|uniref:Uncharacterized protein n=1 Tax=Prunus yedoensis var. nudiflora TaxID=2094558 RepID=A0A314ZD42_PRUYE|nr:hypothetical protein Pyn_14874 [Prunus yedoensis var. nudiflora]